MDAYVQNEFVIMFWKLCELWLGNTLASLITQVILFDSVAVSRLIPPLRHQLFMTLILLPLESQYATSC